MATIADQLSTKYNKNNNPRTDKLTQDHKARENFANSKRQRPANSFQPRPTYLEDGIDHINLWTKGQTDLGRALAMEADINGTVKGMGEFRSVFALWTFLTTKERVNTLRTAPAHVLRSWLKSREQTGNVMDYPNIRFICACMVAKFILDNEEIAQSLADSGDAPIVSYIDMEMTGRMTHPQAEWWVAVIRLIRADLIAGNEITPDSFANMLDNDMTDDEIFQMPEVKQVQRLGMIAKPIQATKVAEVRKEKVKQEKKPEKKEKKPVQVKDLAKDTPVKEHPLKKELDLAENEKVIIIYRDTEERRKFLISTLVTLDGQEFSHWLHYSQIDEEKAPYRSNFPTYVTYNEETKTLVSIATASFDNPYAEFDKRTVSVEAGEFIREKIVKVLDLSPETTLDMLNIRLIRADKPIGELKEVIFHTEELPNGGGTAFVAAQIPDYISAVDGDFIVIPDVGISYEDESIYPVAEQAEEYGFEKVPETGATAAEDGVMVSLPVEGLSFKAYEPASSQETITEDSVQ